MTTSSMSALPPATHRWTIASVDRGEAHRSLALGGAVPQCRTGGAPSYRLGCCRIRCVDIDGTALMIDGPSEAAVRDTARRLLYIDTDGTVIAFTHPAGTSTTSSTEPCHPEALR